MNEEHEMVWRKILCMRTMTRSYAGFRRLLLIRGSRGFSFGLQKIHRLTAHFTVSALPFETGPLVSLLLRITAVQTSVVAAMRVCSWRTSAEHAEHARKLFMLVR